MDNLIEKARAVALEALKDETRYDGTPFIGHPDQVAKIVEDEIGLPDACVARGRRLSARSYAHP